MTDEKRSALGRLGGWLGSLFVTTAEAKGGPEYDRQVELTPDGRYLLISGSHAEEVPSDEEWQVFGQRLAGLTVVDTETMSVVFRESTIGAFTLAPGGRWLLGTGSYFDDSLVDENGFGGLVGHGLKVIDLRSLEVVSHWWPGAEARVGAISPDGRVRRRAGEQGQPG